MTNVEVIGVKETIKELRQFDPEMRKQFNRDAKKIAEPILTDAKNRYPAKYLSGMARTWSQRGRKLFPYTQRDAQRGVVFKIDTGRRATSILTVIQKNPAAAIVDMAGKAGGTNTQGARFIAQLFGTPSRVMWPAAESQQEAVTNAMMDLVKEAAATVENRITVIK
jgi:hypothetical protein